MTTRPPLAPALVALALLSAGCAGSSGHPAAGGATAGTPSAGAAASAAASHRTASRAAARGSAGANPSGAAAGTAGTSAGGPPTGGRSQAPLPPSAGKPATSDATAPGSYTYDVNGTVSAGTPRQVKSTATLKVDPAKGDTQHSSLNNGQGSTDQTVVLRSGGTYLAQLVITSPSYTKTFDPSPAALLVPSPAVPGHSWSWTATSTDGKTKASAQSQVLRQETVTVGGEQVPCVVIETKLTLSGDVGFSSDDTTWDSTHYHLPAKQRQQGSGSYNGFAFTSDITSTLRSTKPA